MSSLKKITMTIVFLLSIAPIGGFVAFGAAPPPSPPGITGGPFGSSTQVGQFLVRDGKVISATNVNISLPTTLPPSGPAGGDLSGTYPNPSLATGVVGTDQIKDAAVTSAKIAGGAITSDKIATGVVEHLLDNLNHVGYPGSAPVGVDCTATTIKGTDNGGVIHFDEASSDHDCFFQFANAYSVPPACVLSLSTPTAVGVRTATNGFTASLVLINGENNFAKGEDLHYVCVDVAN